VPKFVFNPLQTKIQLSKSIEATLFNYRQTAKKQKEQGGVILGKLIPSQNTLIYPS